LTKETLDFVTHLAAEKLHNFFGVFLQFHIGVDICASYIVAIRFGAGRRDEFV
jgi:hypothetical protein